MKLQNCFLRHVEFLASDFPDIDPFLKIEVNQDLYPRLTGMHVHFVTNERGRGSQNKARALLSSFQIPFVRK
jgi:ribosomal protein L5